MHDIPTVGLRFFNVYGPSCRPDSALYNFTTSILDGTPIRLFNFGQHLRDFTYIDDVVASVWAIVSRRIDENKNKNLAKYEILNVGSGKNESLISLVNRLETATGKKAKIFLEDRKKEDPTDTLADNHLIKEHYNWSPQIDLSEGIAKFYQWYLER